MRSAATTARFQQALGASMAVHLVGVLGLSWLGPLGVPREAQTDTPDKDFMQVELLSADTPAEDASPPWKPEEASPSDAADEADAAVAADDGELAAEGEVPLDALAAEDLGPGSAAGGGRVGGSAQSSSALPWARGARLPEDSDQPVPPEPELDPAVADARDEVCETPLAECDPRAEDERPLPEQTRRAPEPSPPPPTAEQERREVEQQRRAEEQRRSEEERRAQDATTTRGDRVTKAGGGSGQAETSASSGGRTAEKDRLNSSDSRASASASDATTVPSAARAAGGTAGGNGQEGASSTETAAVLDEPETLDAADLQALVADAASATGGPGGIGGAPGAEALDAEATDAAEAASASEDSWSTDFKSFQDLRAGSLSAAQLTSAWQSAVEEGDLVADLASLDDSSSAHRASATDKGRHDSSSAPRAAGEQREARHSESDRDRSGWLPPEMEEEAMNDDPWLHFVNTTEEMSTPGAVDNPSGRYIGTHNVVNPVDRRAINNEVTSELGQTGKQEQASISLGVGGTSSTREPDRRAVAERQGAHAEAGGAPFDGTGDDAGGEAVIDEPMDGDEGGVKKGEHSDDIGSSASAASPGRAPTRGRAGSTGAAGASATAASTAAAEIRSYDGLPDGPEAEDYWQPMASFGAPEALEEDGALAANAQQALASLPGLAPTEASSASPDPEATRPDPSTRPSSRRESSEGLDKGQARHHAEQQGRVEGSRGKAAEEGGGEPDPEDAVAGALEMVGRELAASNAVVDLEVQLDLTALVSVRSHPLAPAAERVDARLRQAFDYPVEYRGRGLTGVVVVGFVVQPNGRVTDIKLLKSSGHAELDALALATIPAKVPAPREAEGNSVRFRYSFRYGRPDGTKP